MTKPTEPPREIPATDTLKLLIAEVQARHDREWQQVTKTAAREAAIDTNRWMLDLTTGTWIDSGPPAEHGGD